MPGELSMAFLLGGQLGRAHQYVSRCYDRFQVSLFCVLAIHGHESATVSIAADSGVGVRKHYDLKTT